MHFSRTTTILGLVQTVVVITGLSILGIVFRLSGYPDAVEVRWNPLAVSLREHGAWLLALPAIWVAVAAVAERDEQPFWVPWAAKAVGVAIAVVSIGLFPYAAVFPYTRPLLFYIR